MESLELHDSHAAAHTGMSDIIMQQKQVNIQKNAILTYLLFKKDSLENLRMKNYGMNKWKNFMKDIELYYIKGEMKRLLAEVEKLKFQEQLLRTNFRVQKNELESKVSELI